MKSKEEIMTMQLIVLFFYPKTLPASVYVAAGDGIRYVKAPQFIHFNDFNAASIVVERFRSL